MSNPTYTDIELNEFGDRLARLLGLKRLGTDAEGRQRWATEWGNKTGLGLMRTIQRVDDARRAGTLAELLP